MKFATISHQLAIWDGGMQVLEVQMHSFKCVLTIFLVMQPLPAIYFGHIDDGLLESLSIFHYFSGKTFVTR